MVLSAPFEFTDTAPNSMIHVKTSDIGYPNCTLHVPLVDVLLGVPVEKEVGMTEGFLTSLMQRINTEEMVE